MPVLDALANVALSSRADLASSRQKEASADAILVGAEDALKKKLDVQASLGYAGLSEGAAFWNYLTPMFNRPTGPNFTIGVNWTFSRENNAAIGRMVRSRSQLTQSRIQTGDLERTIQSNVAVAYDAVQHSIDKLAAARDSAALYRSAVQDQADLARLGVTTIIDLINTEDRLTNAQLDELVALQAYALALTQLRYQTGSLLNAQNDVDLTTLTTLPRN
jgi:outer membrane protein TolC